MVLFPLAGCGTIVSQIQLTKNMSNNKKGPFAMALKKAQKEARKAFLDPKKNPAGKNPYKGSVRVYNDEIIVKPAPDAGHSARLRGAAKRKARGTQSSTTRRVIK